MAPKHPKPRATADAVEHPPLTTHTPTLLGFSAALAPKVDPSLCGSVPKNTTLGFRFSVGSSAVAARPLVFTRAQSSRRERAQKLNGRSAVDLVGCPPGGHLLNLPRPGGPYTSQAAHGGDHTDGQKITPKQTKPPRFEPPWRGAPSQGGGSKRASRAPSLSGSGYLEHLAFVNNQKCEV